MVWGGREVLTWGMETRWSVNVELLCSSVQDGVIVGGVVECEIMNGNMGDVW